MDIKELSSECLSCMNPICEKGCPLHNHIRDMIKEVKNGNYLKAREILDETSPFPYICSRVCNYAKQCYGSCIRNRINDPIKIYEIEKELAEIRYIKKNEELNGKRIAIIGAGISALSLAKIMAIKGYEVHIYEKESFIAGTIYSGIPDYRLDRQYIDRIKEEMHELKINFHLNMEYPKDFNLKDLKDLGYDKIIFAIGNMKSNRMHLINDEYAYNGLDLLYDLNILKKHDEYAKYKHVVVVGGGNVAFDCARSLKRIIDNVTITYRRSIKEMPANKVEIKEALDEGVEIKELTNPDMIEKTKDSYKVRCQKMRLNGIGDDGRSLFEIIDGEYEYLKTDLLIMAIGQSTIDYDDEIACDCHNNIIVDDKYMTNIENIYAIGDCITGASNVALAIYHARRCIEVNGW